MVPTLAGPAKSLLGFPECPGPRLSPCWMASLPRGHSTRLCPSGDLIFFLGTGSDDVTNQGGGEAVAHLHVPGLLDDCAPATQERGGGGGRGGVKGRGGWRGGGGVVGDGQQLAGRADSPSN